MSVTPCHTRPTVGLVAWSNDNGKRRKYLRRGTKTLCDLKSTFPPRKEDSGLSFPPFHLLWQNGDWSKIAWPVPESWWFWIARGIRLWKRRKSTCFHVIISKNNICDILIDKMGNLLPLVILTGTVDLLAICSSHLSNTHPKPWFVPSICDFHFCSYFSSLLRGNPVSISVLLDEPDLCFCYLYSRLAA